MVADRYRLEELIGSSADLCAMADAATSAMVSKLDGGIPRRTARFDTGSLFHADACALLDGSTRSTRTPAS